jgi:PmbA protein
MKADEMASILKHRSVQAGATDVVVMVLENEEAMVRFSNNEITLSTDLKEITAHLFIYFKERRAGTSVADLTKRSLEASVDRLVDAAKRSHPSDFYAPLPSGPFEYDRQLMRAKEVPLDPTTITAWVREAVHAAMRAGATRVAGSLTARNVIVTLKTTGNVHGAAARSGIVLSLRAFGQGVASGHAVCVACKERDFDPIRTGTEAGNLAKMANDPIEGIAGKKQAILGPMVFADLVQQVGRMASAFHVDAGLSFLAGKLDQKVGSEKLTVVDDPTIRDALGAMPFDHEGLPTRRTSILEAGVLKSYLHNTTTANAGLINPQPFNLVVEPGRSSLEYLIEQVDDGIYVTNDWYLRYQNYMSGDFSTIPRDAMFLIKDGQIAGSLKDLRICDNVPRILANVRDVGRERKWVKWWEVEIPTLAPTVLIDDVNFTRSST